MPPQENLSVFFSSSFVFFFGWFPPTKILVKIQSGCLFCVFLEVDSASPGVVLLKWFSPAKSMISLYLIHLIGGGSEDFCHFHP